MSRKSRPGRRLSVSYLALLRNKSIFSSRVDELVEACLSDCSSKLMNCVYDCEWITNFPCISECYRLDVHCNKGHISKASLK